MPLNTILIAELEIIYPAKIFPKTISKEKQTSYQEIAGCNSIFILPSAFPSV